VSEMARMRRAPIERSLNMVIPKDDFVRNLQERH
jgi:hypothetical protein